ncbi:family 78 glycoside hydrolase catalytic domain [Paenibacillus filicis]|uniref:Family 78 glycoside hydrolase catalytic domain n=1 Tax=Paenibacillus filicis TaxID=669464 RepID=A0ABU9DL26_9BACL
MLTMFADSRYIVYVNGIYAGRGPCRSDPRWQYVDEIPVSKLLRPGRNCIAVMVLYYGYGTGQSIDRIPALLAELRVSGPEGGTIRIGTDSTWLCRKADAYDAEAPRVNGCQGPIEIYDARLDTGDWHQPDAAEEGWENAQSRGFRLSPFWNFLRRPIPLLEEKELDALRVVNRGIVPMRPASSERMHLDIIEETKGIGLSGASPSDTVKDVWSESPSSAEAEVLTYDFGRIEPGYLQLEVTGTSGTVIDVVYAEELWEGKALLNPNNNRSIDRFILSEGRRRLEVGFGWKACRYVQLRIRHADARPVCVHRVGLRTRRYPMAQHASFRCSDPALQRIWDISEHTLRICMQDAFVDSPSREQQQWMGDGRWQALYQTYYSGDGRLHRKLLEQVGQSQDWQGMTAQRYPDGHHNYPPIPSFCLHWISSFGEYLEAYGDDGLLAEWWPNIMQALRWFSGFENEAGLLVDVPYWAYVDAGEAPLGRWPDVERGGIVTSLNLLYLEAMRQAILYARQVGDQEADNYYTRASDRLADGIKQALWLPEVGTYTECLVKGVPSPLYSESANALALVVLHRAEDERSQSIYKAVFSPEAAGCAIAASPFFMLVVYRALCKLGREERMLELVRERYGPMVEAGATTVWEWWGLFYPDKQSGEVQFSSACHAWGSMPVYMFLQSVLGVRSLKPGHQVVEIAPRLLGGLAWAEGAIPTKCGVLAVRVEREAELAGGIRLNLTVPKGVTVLSEGASYGAGEHVVRMQG